MRTVGKGLLGLVSAVPYQHTGMMIQPPHLVFCLLCHQAAEVVALVRNIPAGEHEVLIDEDSVLIAQIVEQLLFVDSAAPDAQDIEARIPCQREQLPIALLGNRARQKARRDPV